ncbi:MAG TPA: hypothetical protein VKV40_14585 [Ktedonobacteraceae bacterium]|nr:hypothetical protein [Ktedonobacteraceae bacterium]
MYRDGHLVSIALKTLEGIQQELKQPDRALWIIPNFRQARVLLDKDGSMRELQRMVSERRCPVIEQVLQRIEQALE